MRWWLVLLILLPMAQAGSWDDPADDQQYGRTLYMEGGARNEQWQDVGQFGWFPQADVVKASISETQDHLIFEVELSGLDSDPTQEPPNLDNPDEWRYVWTFTYHGDQLIAGFERYGDDPDDVWFHVIDRYESRPGSISISYRMIWFAESTDAPGYRAEIPKWIFRDSDQVPIREGDVLEDITFSSQDGAFFHNDLVPCPNTDPTTPPQYLILNDCGWRVRDLLQDGDVLGDFTVELTPEGVGHLFLRMDDPIRQSNGLATTYVFEAEVHNLEDEPDTAFIQVKDVPKKWEVHYPATVAFAGKEKTTVPIAVSVPFEHQHGVENFMQLSIVSDRDPTVATSTVFGVFFADPAQPGGHHDTLYFHTDPDSEFWGWMNTDVDDDEGTHGPVSSWDTSFTDGTRYSWDFWLSPRLDMGLDFDLSKTGRLVFDLEVPYAFDGQVDAELVLFDWETDSQTKLAVGTTPMTLEAGTPTEVTIELTPEPFADRVPPTPGTNLILLVNATSETPSPPIFGFGDSFPRFHTEDASMQLPLIDYHDEVDLTGLVKAAFDLDAVNGSVRAVNPGKTSVVAFNITNLLDQKMTLDWTLNGQEPFTDWASLATATTHLKPGANGTVVVRYQPPASATEEDIAEFVLIGKAREDDARQVFARIAFFIETDEDIPDEAHLADDLEKAAQEENAKNTKQSPGLPLLGLLAAIAIALRRS